MTKVVISKPVYVHLQQIFLVQIAPLSYNS